jgi:nitroreductase
MQTTLRRSADFYQIIKERRSVRYYDPSVKIPDEEIKEMIGEAILAPNGYNLNAWRFLIITDQALKEKLYPIAYHQQQVLDASAIIAVMGDLEAFWQGERVYQRAVDAGYMTEEVKNSILSTIKNWFESKTPEDLKNTLMIDASLASMQLMLAAKARGYDTVPMSGYDVEQFRKVFNIPDRYVNVMLIALGKAAKPGYPTVRLGVDEVVFWNTMS